jgi:hypothetical protein
MEAEAAKGFRVVLLAVIAVVVEFFKALVVVLVAVAAVLEAVVAEATTVQGVVNKPIMPGAHTSFWR